MPDAPAATESQPENTPAAAADTPEPTEGEATVTVTNGRRRGRRRVMKKKKVKDEDGYLGEEISHVTEHQLTCHSHQRGSCMGVVFRRRACAEEAQASPCETNKLSKG